MGADIGKRIAQLRRARGISQDELAELAQLHRVTVAKYETGAVEPGALALGRIADVLQTTTDDLLGRNKSLIDNPEIDERMMISEQIRRDPSLRILFGQARKAKPEHIRAAAAMLKSLEGETDD
jgi:transcriptional regulator with XRE-family HTH domain